MDYNLQGMNFINVTAVQFRNRDSRGDKTERSKLLSRSVSSEAVSQSSTTFHAPNTFTVQQETVEQMANDIPRSTTCELEVDVVCEDVLNREEIEIKIGTNPGLEAIWRDENQRRAQRGLAPLVAVPPSQDRVNLVPAKSEQYFQQRLAMKCRVSSPLPKSKDNDEVAETVARLVEEVEVMNRGSVLFGVSSQSLDLDVDSSFHLTLHHDPDTHTSSLRNISQLSIDSGQAEMEELLRGLAEERQAAATTDSSPSQTPAADSKVDRETSTDQSMSATLLTLPSSDKTIVTDVPPPMTVHGSSSPERLREATTERSGHLPALTTPAAPAHTQGQEAKSGALSFRQLAGKSAMSNASLGPAMGKQQQKLPAGKKLDRKKKSLLRPAQGFPSRASIKKTAAHHGLFLHANATTVYSDVYQLIEEELKTREDNPHQENKQPLPMERLVEFDSHCINLTSSSLFATAMDYAAGWADEMAEAADERVKTDLAEEVGVEEAVERRMGWLKVGQKREGRLLARGHSGSWKVRLTPLLPFPKLSSMDKVMDSLRAAQANVERGKVQKVPPSATKARHNSQFRALIGDVCGDVAKMNLDVASPAAKAEEATAQVLHESENLLLLSMELQCQRQGADGGPMAIGLICYALMSDTAESPADGIVGFIVLTNETSASRERDRKRFLSWLAGRETFKKVDIEYVASEVQLINSFIAVVQRWDPDIVLGYEIQLSSWGYLIERGTTLGIDMLHSLSRFLKPLVHPLKKRTPKAVAAWEARKMSEIHLVGRVVLNLWRLMRSEVSLSREGRGISMCKCGQ
ncbi:hypothetical protein RvY_18121-2 [Ramazzottius varieornatus]|uniref:DNA-directed DNA polymerase family B exonuclease domain-containing protein n=1 Tax=Ramazzottius varieornatus TaxID=947166 RepID=A0A1D1W4L6_RAMVA|nr:hypothetical protein RvY_18121-2 [Ramazzottius varieornatus]